MGLLASLFLNKYVLMALAAAAIGFGLFETGSAHGYSKGHDVGYQTAWNTQQTAINKLVDNQNEETQAQNLKLSNLEMQASAADFAAQAARAQSQKVRTNVVIRYKQANPQVAASCGWSIPTVQSINQLLNAGSSPATPAAGASQ